MPTQGGFQPGVDFSASTMVIPVVDLTETAEGSSLRQDLQSSYSHNVTTSHNISNTTTTMVNTTGYYRLTGNLSLLSANSSVNCNIFLNDGATSKIILNGKIGNTGPSSNLEFDLILKLDAGDTLQGTTTNTTTRITAITRQIADLQGNLVNP